MKARGKLIILYILSFIASVAPLVSAFVMNRGEYIKAPSDAVKLTVGGLIAAVFIAMKILGKLKLPKGITLYTLVFVMAYLFDAVLDDLMLLSGMALLGEFIDGVLFRPWIKRIKEKITVGKTADATADRIEALFGKYIGGNT